MGLAASQARYLALTARKSDLEFQSQTINTRRLQLAYRTAEIAQAYSEGMNNKMISVSSINKNGETVWNEATFGNLKEAGLVIIPINGNTWKDLGQANPYLNDTITRASGDYKRSTSAAKTYTSLESVKTEFELTTVTKTELEKYFSITNLGTTGTEAERLRDASFELKESLSESIYSAAPAKVKEGYYADNLDKYEVNINGQYEQGANALGLQALLTHGKAQIITQGFYNYLRSHGYNPNGDKGGGISPQRFHDLQLAWTNSTGACNPGNEKSIIDWRADETETLSERSYTEDDEAVLAKYEADTAEVQAQDKILEAQEKNIETQHKAVETELEAIQKVIQGNIEKTFKIFS